MSTGPVIVYHRPGSSEGPRLLGRLLDLLRAEGVEAEAFTIEEALENAGGLRGRRLYMLMFTRGGHWWSLVEAGLRPRLIPLHLTANAVGREARSRGCTPGSLVLVALRAHRLVEQQATDLEALRRLVGLHCPGTRLLVLQSLHAPPAGEQAGLAAPLALLPGRLAGAACRLGEGCLGAFASYGLGDLASWILEEELFHHDQ